MSTVAGDLSVTKTKPLIPRAILWGGLICGVLDIISACVEASIQFDMKPVRLLQGVAGALLGPAALKGGWATALLGLVMHFAVAFTVTAVFYGLSRRFPILIRWPVPSGLAYGALIFLVMFRGVIPLTTALKSLYLPPFTPTLPRLRLAQFLIHLFCIGLPIALVARRFAPERAAK
jgi:hypothetical protein